MIPKTKGISYCGLSCNNRYSTKHTPSVSSDWCTVYRVIHRPPRLCSWYKMMVLFLLFSFGFRRFSKYSQTFVSSLGVDIQAIYAVISLFYLPPYPSSIFLSSLLCDCSIESALQFVSVLLLITKNKMADEWTTQFHEVQPSSKLF